MLRLHFSPFFLLILFPAWAIMVRVPFEAVLYIYSIVLSQLPN